MSACHRPRPVITVTVTVVCDELCGAWLSVSDMPLALLAPLVAVWLGGTVRLTAPISHGARRCVTKGSAEERSSPSSSAVVRWREDSTPESVIPDVSLTRSRDGSTGTATFRFEDPSILSVHDVWDNGLITGLWLHDEEGTLVTQDLDVIFKNGRPCEMTAIVVLKSASEWERFMRFMARYAEASGLEFSAR